jgi:hypothetical protein
LLPTYALHGMVDLVRWLSFDAPVLGTADDALMPKVL